MSENPAPQKNACVICGKPKSEEFKPFCSKRCQQVDLHRWFSGHYAIPAVESDDEQDQDES